LLNPWDNLAIWCCWVSLPQPNLRFITIAQGPRSRSAGTAQHNLVLLGFVTSTQPTIYNYPLYESKKCYNKDYLDVESLQLGNLSSKKQKTKNKNKNKNKQQTTKTNNKQQTTNNKLCPELNATTTLLTKASR